MNLKRLERVSYATIQLRVMKDYDGSYWCNAETQVDMGYYHWLPGGKAIGSACSPGLATSILDAIDDMLDRLENPVDNPQQ